MDSQLPSSTRPRELGIHEHSSVTEALLRRESDLILKLASAISWAYRPLCRDTSVSLWYMGDATHFEELHGDEGQ